jgi:hypothetical protein
MGRTIPSFRIALDVKKRCGRPSVSFTFFFSYASKATLTALSVTSSDFF